MEQEMVPHSSPTLGNEEVVAVSDVIKSGYISSGDKVRQFEEALAGFIGTKGAVAVNSGTSAFDLGLRSMGIGAGDDVLLPSFVCTAPLNAVYRSKAKPCLCDINIEDFNISLDSMRDNITDSTKAVIVPHMFGNPADLLEISDTGVTVIEDCAHSIGAVYGERLTGSFGRFSIFSFYVNKMIACGEGGALLSDDESLLRAVRDLRDYDEKESYEVRCNFKMTDMQAAMGLVQLKKLPGFISRRKEIAARYDDAFQGLDISLPAGEFDHIYYRYVVRIMKDLAEVISFLKEKRVTCARPVFKPLHRYLELRSGFRNTDEVYSTALSIPVYPSLTDEEQERVISAVKECFG